MADKKNCPPRDRLVPAYRLTHADVEAALRSLYRIGAAITPNVDGKHDESGGFVTSLTEAAMGTTTALMRIADALNNVADAIREGHARPDEES